MPDWKNEIAVELRRAKGSRNPGQLRTAARRIAGIAIEQLQKREGILPAGRGYMNALRAFVGSGNIPAGVSAAAERLEARLSADFTSQSIDPVGDAMLIVEYVKCELGENSKEKKTSKPNINCLASFEMKCYFPV